MLNYISACSILVEVLLSMVLGNAKSTQSLREVDSAITEGHSEGHSVGAVKYAWMLEHLMAGFKSTCV